MTGHDWETIKDVFSAALLLTGSAREAYIDRACADRPGLGDAVRDLLRAHQEASVGFLAPEGLSLHSPWLFDPGAIVAGRFHVVRPIARGGMGEVYEAHDDRLHMNVALKAIRPELISDPESIERFRREVRVTREIAHAHICRVFDLVEHVLPPSPARPNGGTLPCLTMQLLQGQTLETWVDSHRPAPASEVLPLVVQIADALHTLHEAGIVHRDLKPSNVMLVDGPDGPRAVLTDFGLARRLDAGLFETQHAVQGAPYYMAPELFRGHRPSRASDIYALGLLVDELVTDTRAFSADSLHSLLLQKLEDGPVPPSQRSRALPAHWDDAIRQALDPDPNRRPASALALVHALTRRAPGLNADNASPTPVALRRLLHPAVLGAVALTASTVALTAPLVTSSPASTSVVLLPFENQTGDLAHEYLALEAAAGLAGRLEAVQGFIVYRAHDQDATVRADKRADLALSGQLRQTPTGLRLVAQITNGARDRVLWSGQYDMKPAELLLVEQQLVTDAVEIIGREADTMASRRWIDRLSSWSRRALGGPLVPPQRTTNAEAYDAYIRGRALAEERTLEPTLAAKQLFERAAQLDPQYAAPHAALADLQAILMELQVAPHATLLREAAAHAGRAVALAPDLADAHLSLAGVLQMQGQWDAAEQEFKRALDLHPKFARAHRWYGGMLLQFNRVTEAFNLLQSGLDLDPYDIPSQSAYGLALFYGRRPLDAARHLEALLAQKDFMPSHMVVGQVYAYLAGRAPSDRVMYRDRALHESALLRAYHTDATQYYGDLVGGLAWSYFGQADEAAPYLDRLVRSWRAGTKSSSYAARVLGVQARGDEAMEALLAAEAANDRELMYLAVSPHYDALRGRPDFQALLARLGLDSARRQ
jgi:serine/threonine protein kinase/tetratricopeptide (TPR) repeat protein